MYIIEKNQFDVLSPRIGLGWLLVRCQVGGKWLPGGFQVVWVCESFRGQSEGFLEVCCTSRTRHWYRIRKFKNLSPRLIRTRIELLLHVSTLAILIILTAWLKCLHYMFSLSSLCPHIYSWYYHSPISDDILVIYRNHLPNFGGLK